jgi:hypothetical protein
MLSAAVFAVVTVLSTLDCAHEELPFGGLCPREELVCPPCPEETPFKCPSGGCTRDIRTCEPNLWFKGTCNSTVCEGVQWCHAQLHRPYSCWEVYPSTANGTVRFVQLGPAGCSSCFLVRSRYPCGECCGSRGIAAWRSTHETNAPGRDGGAVFMQGSRWVCLLAAVAEQMNLLDASPAVLTGVDTPDDASPGVSGSAEPRETAAPTWTEYDFPMPVQFSLS